MILTLLRHPKDGKYYAINRKIFYPFQDIVLNPGNWYRIINPMKKLEVGRYAYIRIQ